MLDDETQNRADDFGASDVGHRSAVDILRICPIGQLRDLVAVASCKIGNFVAALDVGHRSQLCVFFVSFDDLSRRGAKLQDGGRKVKRR